ncbi:hypothetical protein HK100_001330 [Physocladia obscura]|uniref:Uncharacterized protein n=1 Tax=Physocladia obscura TaxID=109957 RepID=A0AAD5XB46_9FUNG|nr:hypothetical protein HK100_001330 [Physocladia obscura]
MTVCLLAARSAKVSIGSITLHSKCNFSSAFYSIYPPARWLGIGFRVRSYTTDEGNSNVNWAQIGLATETIQHDLDTDFFKLSTRGIKGLTTWSIYHRQISFTDPFHAASILANQTTPVPPSPQQRSQKNSHLVTGRIAYGYLIAILRLILIAYYHDASIEIIRCKNIIGGPLRDSDLDDDYSSFPSPSSSPNSSIHPTPHSDNKEPRSVWRRRPRVSDSNDSNEGSAAANLLPRDDAVRLVVRWMFEGTPRHKFLYAKILSPLSPPQPSVYEGVFVYKFDNPTGLIINHRLESMSPTPWVPKICRWWIDRKKKTNAKQSTAQDDGLPQLNSDK